MEARGRSPPVLEQMKKAAANVGAMSIGICRSLGRWPMDGLSRQATWV